MENENIKTQTISSMLWSAVGRFGTLGISFVSNMVLARLLSPQDFGYIGMLYIFIALSDVLIIGGFGAALIQKKNPTHLDYTSVFYWNLFVAIILYFILYLSAPLIADFYNMPLLCEVFRIQSLSLIIGAFSLVQTTQLQKQLRFKEFSVRGIVSALCGVTVSIIMAFMGYGIWSLVALSLVMSLSSVILLWKMSEWRPTLEFSMQSLKSLFSFGGLMALSSFVETLYTNVQGLIIGKWFTPQDLGYYTQARKLEQVPTSALSMIVGQVAFPVFSMLNEEKTKLRNGVSKSIKSISYLSVPMCVLLIVIAKPLIYLLYGPKWGVSVFYFQILCLSGVAYIINCINLNVIKSLGKGKVYLTMQMTKRLIGISMIFGGITFGVIGVVASVAITFYIDFLINGFVNKKMIGYGVKRQLCDIKEIVAIAIALGVLIYFVGQILPLQQYIVMFIQILLFVSLYLLITSMLKFESAKVYQNVLFNLFICKLNNGTKRFY